jgi:DNA polymerase-4
MKREQKKSLRKIIHIDMDCFYAAIEMRDNPGLRGRAIAVGGTSERRGVLCTCNYEARKFGVRSAMATAKAYQLCPDLLVLPIQMEKYKQASAIVRNIFLNHTEAVEPLSLDEAFLDVTGTQECFGSATWLAEKIRKEIYEQTQLTASAGIAPNKFLAKLASDWHKPNGQFVIPPEDIAAFMPALPVSKIFGVGKVTLRKLNNLGIETCADLQKMDVIALSKHFGIFGQRLFELCRGHDERPVNSNRERKSISVENTYSEDISDLNSCMERLPELVDRLKKRSLNKLDRGIKGVFIKVKFNDFSQTTVDSSFDHIELHKYQLLLEQAFMRVQKPVRLLGVGLRLNLDIEMQLDLGF